MSLYTYALIGTTVIATAITVAALVFQQIKEEPRRRKIYDELERLNCDLIKTREDLERLKQDKKSRKQSRRNRKSTESTYSTSSGDYTTASENFLSLSDADSDSKFLSLSEDENDNNTIDVGDVERGQNFTENDYLTRNLVDIDEILDDEKQSAAILENCIDRLKDLCIENPENPQLIWRIGKAHYKLSEKTEDKVEKMTLLNTGIEACSSALDYTPELAASHKWSAILLGARTEYESIGEKIETGHVFKQHLDRGIELDPTDELLYHMLGRFRMEVASLTWYERTAASMVFGEPPIATYAEARESFEQAEKLRQIKTGKPWKSNKFYLGKCILIEGDKDEGVRILEEALVMHDDEDNDDDIDNEIKTLLKKYS